MADSLCHRSFFSCKGETLNRRINIKNNNSSKIQPNHNNNTLQIMTKPHHKTILVGSDPGEVWDSSRLAIHHTLSRELPFSCRAHATAWCVHAIAMYPFYFKDSLRVSPPYLSIIFGLFFFAVFLFSCDHHRWSFVDVPLIFFCPADHVLDRQPRTLLVYLVWNDWKAYFPKFGNSVHFGLEPLTAFCTVVRAIRPSTYYP